MINVNIKCKTLINDCINSSDFLAYKVNFYVQHLAPSSYISKCGYCYSSLVLLCKNNYSSAGHRRIKERVRDRLALSLLVLGIFSELNNYYSPQNQQQTYGFLMISGGIEVIRFNSLNIRSEFWNIFCYFFLVSLLIHLRPLFLTTLLIFGKTY